MLSEIAVLAFVWPQSLNISSVLAHAHEPRSLVLMGVVFLAVAVSVRKGKGSPDVRSTGDKLLSGFEHTEAQSPQPYIHIDNSRP
jgi:hypothetical protein